MSVQVRRRREAAAFLSTFVGAQGELLVDTTNNRVQVHDGATPGGWPAAKLADVIGRTAVADAAYTALATDRTIAFTALTAARTVSLPAASAYPTGTQLLVVDESGQCSASRAIILTRAGSDTINGATSAVITLAYGFLAVDSDGVSKWTIVDQSTASLAQQSAAAVAITGGTLDRTAIGQTTPAAGSFTTLSAATMLTASANTSSLPATASGTLLRVANADGNSSRIVIKVFGDNSISPNMTFRHARGTAASPSAVQGGDQLLNVASFGYGATGYSSSTRSGFVAWAAENWTDTAQGTYFTIGTTPTGSIVNTERLRVDSGGNLIVNGGTQKVIGPDGSHYLPSYTVATLPTPGNPGRMVFCANARMFNGAGTLEGAGAGSGGLVVDNGAAWKIAGTNITASA